MVFMSLEEFLLSFYVDKKDMYIKHIPFTFIVTERLAVFITFTFIGYFNTFKANRWASFKYLRVSSCISKEILVNLNSVADDDSDNYITRKKKERIFLFIDATIINTNMDFVNIVSIMYRTNIQFCTHEANVINVIFSILTLNTRYKQWNSNKNKWKQIELNSMLR